MNAQYWIQRAVDHQEQAARLAESARDLRDLVARWKAEGESDDDVMMWHEWSKIDQDQATRQYAAARWAIAQSEKV